MHQLVEQHGSLLYQQKASAQDDDTRWSTSGEAGQRVLSRKDPEVSPLVAAALALHGLSIPPPATGGWMVGV